MYPRVFFPKLIYKLSMRKIEKAKIHTQGTVKELENNIKWIYKITQILISLVWKR